MGAAADDSVIAYVTVEPPIIPFHKQAHYTITVEVPPEVEPRFPDMVEKFGGLGVYGAPHRTVEVLKGNRRRI